MARHIVNPGDKFGKWEIVREAERVSGASGTKYRAFLCRCSCGQSEDKIVRSMHLFRGDSVSCGCHRVAVATRESTTHGHSHHPLYRVWRSMNDRCTKPINKSYKIYGARGISICTEWSSSYPTFYDWAVSHGWAKGLQIDRIDNNSTRGYCPENCRFVTRSQNARNTRTNKILTAFGISMCVADWADLTAIQSHTINKRIRGGWSHEDALSIPVGEINRHANS